MRAPIRRFVLSGLIFRKRVRVGKQLVRQQIFAQRVGEADQIALNAHGEGRSEILRFKGEIVRVVDFAQRGHQRG